MTLKSSSHQPCTTANGSPLNRKLIVLVALAPISPDPSGIRSCTFARVPSKQPKYLVSSAQKTLALTVLPMLCPTVPKLVFQSPAGNVEATVNVVGVGAVATVKALFICASPVVYPCAPPVSLNPFSWIVCPAESACGLIVVPVQTVPVQVNPVIGLFSMMCSTPLTITDASPFLRFNAQTHTLRSEVGVPSATEKLTQVS